MKHLSLLSFAFLAGGVITLSGLAGKAWAQTPLEPIHHVYPESTHEDIQDAIDTGGTVYFHYGVYDQLATAADFAHAGFNVGADGNDVHIIGILGPGGARPRINGGKVVFRVGTNFFLGLYDLLAVSFRIENLELFHPELATPYIASRIGVWVTALDAESVINNCRIMVVGDEADDRHFRNHSVGIWFFLLDIPPAPPSGATIAVTNNTIIGSKIHEGVHVDSFKLAEDGFTPPRPVIANNVIDVTELGGFPNGAGTNGATLASALLVEGNLLNPVVTRNVFMGDARSPGVDPPVESVAIALVPASDDNDVLEHVTIVGNDASGFTGDFQLWVDNIVGSSSFEKNAFGYASRAGVRSSGHESEFVNNRFHGPYPGWAASPDGPGLFWFTGGSYANVVQATKLNGPPYGHDICGQVRDESAANEIDGIERCH